MAGTRRLLRDLFSRSTRTEHAPSKQEPCLMLSSLSCNDGFQEGVQLVKSQFLHAKQKVELNSQEPLGCYSGEVNLDLVWLIFVAFLKLEVGSLQLYVKGLLFWLFYPVTVDRLSNHSFWDEKQ